MWRYGGGFSALEGAVCAMSLTSCSFVGAPDAVYQWMAQEVSPGLSGSTHKFRQASHNLGEDHTHCDAALCWSTTFVGL